MTLYCNGGRANADDLAGTLVNYGHFTSLQVRGGAAQGLDLHLQRLAQGTQELFGTVLDTCDVQAWMGQALQAEGRADASLRVTVFSRRFDFRQPLAAVPVEVMVSVGPPASVPASPSRLCAVRSPRDLPHLKHVGTFALFAHRRRAQQDGFDDALLLTADGQVSEGTTWNIAFQRGDQVVWPDAPALRGTAQQLLQAGLGIGQSVQPLTLDALGEFDGALACNASGIWPIAAVDALAFAQSEAFCQRARAVLAAVPWQPVRG